MYFKSNVQNQLVCIVKVWNGSLIHHAISTHPQLTPKWFWRDHYSIFREYIWKITHKFLISPVAAYQIWRTLKAEHVNGISSLYLILILPQKFSFLPLILVAYEIAQFLKETHFYAISSMLGLKLSTRIKPQIRWSWLLHYICQVLVEVCWARSDCPSRVWMTWLLIVLQSEEVLGGMGSNALLHTEVKTEFLHL